MFPLVLLGAAALALLYMGQKKSDAHALKSVPTAEGEVYDILFRVTGTYDQIIRGTDSVSGYNVRA